MKQNVILTFAKGYRMENDQKTGFNEGISLHYLLKDDLLPTGDDKERGIRFSKSSVPLDKGKNIVKVPGLYEFDFEIKSDAQGKILLKLTDLKFLSECNLSFPSLKS